MRKTLFKNVLFSVIVVIGFFLLVEVSFRLFWGKWRDPNNIYQIAKVLRHELKPNNETVFRYGDGVYSVITNSAGLRDRELNPQKETLFFRIIGLGDSITFGSYVNGEDTYLYKLETMLNNTASKRRFEVINAGVPGYGSIHESIFFKQKLFKYKPDLVTIGFCLNDVEDTDGFKPLASLPYYARKLASYSFLAHHIGLGIARLRSQKRGGTAYSAEDGPEKGTLAFLNRNYSEAMNRAWEKTKAALLEIVKSTEAGGAEAVLVIFPYAVQLAEARPPDPQQILSDFAKENGIMIVDLWDAFREKSGSDKLYIDDTQGTYSGIHLSPYGHVIAAEEIQRFLIDKGLIE